MSCILRNRKLFKSQNDTSVVSASKDSEEIQSEKNRKRLLLKVNSTVNLLLGIGFMFLLSFTYAWYIETIHENSIWFSTLKEVEREISFRTESGLHYSYYKQLVLAPSLTTGIVDLIYDNITEYGRTINILHRFNIYQEVVLATIYHLIRKKIIWQPIIFYVKAIWSLQGVYMGALYVHAWLLSESWPAGILTLAFFIIHRMDMTRVTNSPPLRESFSVPFLYVQLVCISYYLNPYSNKVQRMVSWLLQISTFLFCITWQFSQFILLLQALTLFFLALLNIIPIEKVNILFRCSMISLLVVGVLQFFNPMIFNSPVLSFIIAAYIILNNQDNRECYKKGIISNFIQFMRQTAITFILAFCISFCIKQIICQEADSHIFKYILLKFGLGNPRDFEARVYLCSAAFQYLSFSTITRLSQTYLFHLYLSSVLVGLACLINYTLNYWRIPISTVGTLSSTSEGNQCKIIILRPEISFLVVLSLLFGIMALTTRRMIVLWSPLMSILASVILSDKHIWRYLLEKIDITKEMVILLLRHSLTLFILFRLIYVYLPDTRQELKQLGQFWDPDTVELMDWINVKTGKHAAFSGSMQLLAGVKLCTGRPITNHPHFENQWLRKRTLEVYQIYGCQYPINVHSILKRIGTKYIILEDSICLIPAKSQTNCRLRDLIDLSNRHIPEHSGEEKGLTRPLATSFCDTVRYNIKGYTQLFKLVFINPTFRVYRVR